MTDAVTRKPLRVIPNEQAGPYIRVPASQLAEVVRLLKERGVRCWAEEHVISIDGAPAMGFVILGKNGNAAEAQAVLDAIP